MALTNGSDLLKISLLKFYKNSSNAEKFANVKLKNTKYSLRILEWFSNNYSKSKNITYKLPNNKEFNVYFSYQKQLESFQKKRFDPFKRSHEGYDKFFLKYGPNDSLSIETTISQLNFFKWCIENNILEYTEKHLKEIKDDMSKYTPKKSTNSKKTPKQSIPPDTVIEAKRICSKKYSTVIMKFK
jgi:hypothetical protein